ncbi:unnamed protein product, partial [Mesorhabditis belari]|uniref:Uncharacterized protein n=1 Tax=Mesorhabditis belari TaxID=2138241 RepID=A0AAF3EXI9_9BILA
MGSVVKAEMATCHSLIANTPTNSTSDGCGVSFDKSLCWLPAQVGEQVQRLCPFTYCTEIPGCEDVSKTFMVTRTCTERGWNNSDYNQCLALLSDYKQCVVGFCHSCPDLLRDLVISASLTLSIVSVILLLAAIILFSIFDSIQCRRLSIHKNLAVAFVFRFAVLALWTITQTSFVFQDCTGFLPRPKMHLDIACKIILWFVIYFQVASVMWMLIEGAYLYSRFTVYAMRHNDAPYSVYMLCGWGVPVVVVSAWTIIHNHKSSQNSNSFCWLPYAQGTHLWILAGTMGLALILNLLFLLGIVIILVQKLRTENSAESKKIWRTIKATLLLVPLLGISNIPLFYEPEQPSSVYMLGSAILQHSQGIFIAVLYCFLNSEIQNAVKRQLSKVPITGYFINRRQRFETEFPHTHTERTYVPPENRTSSNHRLGVPMEELNGTTTTTTTTTTTAKSPSKESMQSNGNHRLETIKERDSQTS